MRLVPNTPEPKWEHVAAIGLTSHADQPDDDTMPGALDIHCYRAPDSALEDAPFIVELENHQTGQRASVATDRHSLLCMAQTMLHAALHAHPREIDPEDYFSTSYGQVS